MNTMYELKAFLEAKRMIVLLAHTPHPDVREQKVDIGLVNDEISWTSVLSQKYTMTARKGGNNYMRMSPKVVMLTTMQVSKLALLLEPLQYWSTISYIEAV